ncbi:heme peroxidase [Rhizophagus clarus]|uniref:Heme peroxidase n=1 Tax=Rhizophagus clarus TaxID=94130 RepID=A0A8H3L7R4_9GLOM|nr:heme peroxidase [Rhizophagus clarus]
MINHLIILFLISLLFKSVYTEYRTLNGSYNNLNNPFLPTTLARNNPPISFFNGQSSASPNNNFQSLPSTPGNYTSLVPNNLASCGTSANLPGELYPLPRCVSNIVGSIRANLNDVYNLNTLEKYKSKRKISHISTFWGFFTSFDIISGEYSGENYPTGIYIPPDDQLYTSRYSQGQNLSVDLPSFQFNRSSPTQNLTGTNPVTPFIDGSQLYGVNIEQLSRVRDYGNRGKMLLFSTNDTDDSKFGYPPKDINGEYIFGYTAAKGRNLFTDVFYIIFLREHNRKCDHLWSIYGDSWSDEVYFQECRKWVIGLLQHISFYEYLGITLGSPLPPYDGYDPTLEPIIDTFFATITYRYGHSEISDYYDIVNNEGNVLTTLPLTSLQIPHLLESYGIPTLILSMALQRQEEIDIYFADMMRKFIAQYQNQTEEMDIFSLDVIRSRDRAIPLYNDARYAMGLGRANDWSDITNDTDVQQRLIDTYSNDINKVEAFFGGLAEDHVNGSDFGELFYKSFYDQWVSVRNSDRLWYESLDAEYSQADIAEINNTTLSQVITRNTPNTYQLPSNIWIVQPSISLKSVSDLSIPDPNGLNTLSTNTSKFDDPQSDYPPLNHVSLSDIYKVYWKIVNDEIYFKLIIASTTAWFAIGFNDKDSMITSDMIIFRNTNNNIEVRQYKSDGYITPELLNEQLVKVRQVDVQSGVYSLVEISRPLEAKGSSLEPITENNLITMIYAWNPSNNILTYHAGNKGSMKMDFFASTKIDEMQYKKRRNLLYHGIAMFFVWAILYPFSIWRVRFMKTSGSYMKKHRNLQILGVFIVSISGGVALAISEIYLLTVHGIIGIIIFFLIGIQIVLGLFNMWSLMNVESVNVGILRLLKHVHCVFGVLIIVFSLINVYIGIKEYAQQFVVDKIWSILYSVWIGILIIIFVVSENIIRIREIKFRYNKIDSTRDNHPKQQLRDFIKDYDQLPMLTLDEFNQRVIRGMKLVILGNMIFDIGKWIKYHPGGAKILQRVIGTNITRDFFGSNNGNDQTESNFEEDEYDVHTSDQEQKKNLAAKRNNNKKRVGMGETFANFIDVININKTLGKKSSRVSVHSHSRFATKKLATMVVAILSDENEKSFTPFIPQPFKQHYTSSYNQPPPQVDPPNLSPSIFHRCIITNIEIVTDNYQTDYQTDSPIVKKFNLKPIHKNDNFPYRKFIPGDYIEIMCDIDNQKIIRHYCPLLQEFSEDHQEDKNITETNKVDKMFWILVKIYKNGFMSKYLDKQLKNFEISVRGPYNLSDNVIPSNQSLSYSNCILLNPNNPKGCWDNLFMICGGSGITPMLQLIHYHLKEFEDNLHHQQYSTTSFKLHLLYANNSISDIIYPRHLDNMIKRFKGNFNITHILINPPLPDWNGLKGYIDDIILFDWLSNNININNITPTVAKPTQIVYYPQQQQQLIGSSFDDYNIPKSAIVMPYSSDQQQQHYSTSQDPLIESSSTTIKNFPDNSKIFICV